MKDYVAYVHTDSCVIQTYEWLKDNGVTDDQWNKLSEKQKIDIVTMIADEVNGYINEKSYEITQKKHYNSQVHDFKTTFEVEKIALSTLISQKARNAAWIMTADGKYKNAMAVTGMEVIRSDSPNIVKPMIRNVLEMVLKHKTDEKIQDYIKDCRKKLFQCSPSEIAENKGINKLDEYLLPNYKWKTGTPHQLKGVANYKFLTNKLGITNKYEEPMQGSKAKIVYIKQNPYNINSISFIE